MTKDFRPNEKNEDKTTYKILIYYYFGNHKHSFNIYLSYKLGIHVTSK